jgi:hypothetical protein
MKLDIANTGHCHCSLKVSRWELIAVGIGPNSRSPVLYVNGIKWTKIISKKSWGNSHIKHKISIGQSVPTPYYPRGKYQFVGEMARIIFFPSVIKHQEVNRMYNEMLGKLPK